MNTNVTEELAERLVEGGLSNEDAKKYAARIVYLTERHTKLAVMASEGGHDQDRLDGAKEELRERLEHQVTYINHLAFASGSGPALKSVQFSFDPRAATVSLELTSGRANRIEGTWGVQVDDEALESLDGDIMLDALNWRQDLKDRLADRRQDPKYLDQMLGKMCAENATSLDDAEIERVLKDVVLSGYCIQYVKAARECGLRIEDLFPDVQMDLEIQEHSVDDTPSPM